MEGRYEFGGSKQHYALYNVQMSWRMCLRVLERALSEIRSICTVFMGYCASQEIGA
jgi:hypothetical protein